MNTKSGFESVKQFFEKIGKRNLVIAGAVALISGIFFAWRGLGLFPVALIACGAVFLLELFLV